MARTACTEPQCLYKGTLYLFYLCIETTAVCVVILTSTVNSSQVKNTSFRLCISCIGRTMNIIHLFSNCNLCLYKQNIKYEYTFGYSVLSYHVLSVAILICNASGMWHHAASLETSYEFRLGFLKSMRNRIE